ncbi:hypothetical protein [Methylobacter tundripaludum]|uniref:hypothetical protein n=1 Tax=Methylobacter tundripaludum TaxID=173365 RepID=UPI0004DF4F54|nr:hypothetical protein [Methylobacter tundripaludum]
MIFNPTEHTIDLGEVGFWHSKQPFRVHLEASSLVELIGHAESIFRVYELMLIERPGDVWDYVGVIIKAVPSAVADRVKYVREKALPPYGDNHPWPEGRIPFTVFDKLFFWSFYDTAPEDEAWLSYRDTPPMRAFAQQLLTMVSAAQCRLDRNDGLFRYVVTRFRSGEHPYGYLERRIAIEKGREYSPNCPTHTTAFYKKLDELLCDPDLASVAYRADGDYHVLRMMAAEQRRRADRTGHSAGHAMHLSALVNHKISNEAWDSEIRFFEEGLAHGDLFIEGGGLGGENLKSLVEKHHCLPGRYILSTKDEGCIKGFDIESGDGWVLYRKRFLDGGRRGLERIESRRHSSLGPVLNFGGQGTTVFDYDKTVMVVGEEVASPVRAALAIVMVEWQQHGGDPVLIVLGGDIRPFEMVGCLYLLQPAVCQEQNESNTSAGWLRAVLQQMSPWIDIIIALDAPLWAAQVLADRVSSSNEPWSPWVVTSSCVEQLQADLVIEGNLAKSLVEAHLRAQMMRPQIL